MKMIALLAFFSVSIFAQFPKLPDSAAGLKDVSKQVLEACKEDKSKIKACESYTEMQKLKACLLQNKDKLSEKCKMSLKLVK